MRSNSINIYFSTNQEYLVFGQIQLVMHHYDFNVPSVHNSVHLASNVCCTVRHSLQCNEYTYLHLYKNKHNEKETKKASKVRMKHVRHLLFIPLNFSESKT